MPFQNIGTVLYGHGMDGLKGKVKGLVAIRDANSSLKFVTQQMGRQQSVHDIAGTLGVFYFVKNNEFVVPVIDSIVGLFVIVVAVAVTILVVDHVLNFCCIISRQHRQNIFLLRHVLHDLIKLQDAQEDHEYDSSCQRLRDRSGRPVIVMISSSSFPFEFVRFVFILEPTHTFFFFELVGRNEQLRALVYKLVVSLFVVLKNNQSMQAMPRRAVIDSIID